MKVIQTPVRFSPYRGGVEKYVHDFGLALKNKGVVTEIICADEPRGSPSRVDGMRVIRLAYPGKIANTNITPMLPVRLLKSEADIYHTHIPTPWSADWSALTAWVKSRPLIVTYHNELPETGLKGVIARAYNNTFLHFVLWRAKFIIVTQEANKTRFKHICMHKEKLRVVPIGVDIRRFRPGKEKRQGIFFLSVLDQYHKYKGLDVLLRAQARIVKEHPEAKLYIGGDGSEAGKYKQLCKKMGLSQHVEFLGRISDKELEKRYRKSEVFVLPSVNYQEGFGIVALEAMASGTPVICTDIVGVAPDIINDGCGKVVRAQDEHALENAISEVLADDGKARRMGLRARKLACTKYSWERVGSQMAQLYAAAAGANHKRRGERRRDEGRR